MLINELSWNEFKSLSTRRKASVLSHNDIPMHVLYSQQFDRKFLDSLGELATRIRFIAKNRQGALFLMSLLQEKRAILYFTQPSSRTFLSFNAACQILGLKIGEVRDSFTSSEVKGESREDSVRTFSSYYDLIIMRSEIGGLAERMAWVLSNSERPVPIINAGSGKDQHPTQALLDIYTLQRSFENRGGIDGKTILFVGDLLRGRTVRSLAYLLTNYEDMHLIFTAPDELQIKEDIINMLRNHNISFELSNDFIHNIQKADAIYMTRIQDEWDANKGDSAKIDISMYSLNKSNISYLKDNAVIMHPLPRREEISTDIDSDPRAVYWRQMRNGMWIRVALIANIFNKVEEINQYYEEMFL